MKKKIDKFNWSKTNYSFSLKKGNDSLLKNFEFYTGVTIKVTQKINIFIRLCVDVCISINSVAKSYL